MTTEKGNGKNMWRNSVGLRRIFTLNKHFIFAFFTSFSGELIAVCKQMFFCFCQTLLGQKYGYRPFKAKIFEKEFEVMTSSIENVDDVNLLEKWFIRDDNLSPPMYILQPIRDLIPNYNNWLVTAEDRSKASSEWWGAFERMQVVLRDAAEKCLLNEEEISKYKISGSVNSSLLCMEDFLLPIFPFMYLSNNAMDLQQGCPTAARGPVFIGQRQSLKLQ